MCRDIAKTTVTRFSHVVWLGIVQCLFNCLCYYSRATLGIKGTCPLTRGVRCHGVFVLHFAKRDIFGVWSTWSWDILNWVVFRLRIDFWWQCTFERTVILSQKAECLACVSVWRPVTFVEPYCFGKCIGFEVRYLLFWNKSIISVRGGSTVQRAPLFSSVLWTLKCCHFLFWLSLQL